MKNNFRFNKVNYILLAIAILTLVIGYAIMGNHRTPLILQKDIIDAEAMSKDIQNAKDMYNLNMLKNLTQNSSEAINQLNIFIKNESFLSKQVLQEIELIPEARMMLETSFKKKNPDKIKYRYSKDDYLTFYQGLSAKDKQIINRYVIEEILPNGFSKYINRTGENTISVILMILGYVVLIPLAIIYRKKIA